jgi:hypothetical protein
MTQPGKNIPFRTSFCQVLLLTTLTGCGISPAVQSGYPAPKTNITDAYPGPTSSAISAKVVERTLVSPKPPEGAPPPQPGMASISGLLFSVVSFTLIPETLFYITPALGNQRDQMPPLLAGPTASRGDLAGRSGEDGSFQLDKIPPGNYFLIVSSPASWCEAVRSDVDLSPRILSLSSGQALALGVVAIIWP